jgi:hypothetical protein
MVPMSSTTLQPLADQQRGIGHHGAFQQRAQRRRVGEQLAGGRGG